MPAFDITTKPTSLSLKPGSTGSIMVVVSNRLGKPVMGSVTAAMTPETATGWLVPPPPEQTQRRYEADPAATVSLEYNVAVPKDAAAQVVQFKATVRDVLSPDDTKVEGQTVNIDVTPEAKDDGGGHGIPWWVWLIVAAVVIGLGVGIWMIVRPKGTPDVVGKPPAEAVERLKKAGYDSVAVIDTLGDQTQDTNRVIRQAPEPGTKIEDTETTLVATIVVNRSATQVPVVANQPVSVAIERLRQAGLVLGRTFGQYTGNIAQNQTIYRAEPPEGTSVPVHSTVDLRVFAFSPQPPPQCPNPRVCVVEIPPDLRVRIDDWRKTHFQGLEAERVQ